MVAYLAVGLMCTSVALSGHRIFQPPCSVAYTRIPSPPHFLLPSFVAGTTLLSLDADATSALGGEWILHSGPCLSALVLSPGSAAMRSFPVSFFFCVAVWCSEGFFAR